MRFQKTGSVLFLGILTLFLSSTPALSEPVDLLRKIPLQVDGYASGRAFPERFSTMQEVVRVLDSTPVPLVHMEAIRRTLDELPAAEQQKLLLTLSNRHKAKENDLMRYFDLGYAQLVLKRQKSGLFFLRKAADAHDLPYAGLLNLAYGMAQVEADLTMEGAKPEEVTVRKMDATYRLADAVKLDAENHQPGFWPAFVRVIDIMKTMPAYHSFVRRDFSLAFVPPGKKFYPSSPAVATLPTATTLVQVAEGADGASSSCGPVNGASNTERPNAPLLTQQNANFDGNVMQIQFFGSLEGSQRQVRVLDATRHIALDFQTYARPGQILEDLDGDGVSEIVVRQYAENPLHPVQVYRFTPCGFEWDAKIADLFQ